MQEIQDAFDKNWKKTESTEAEEAGEDWAVRTQRMTPEEIQAATGTAAEGDARLAV